MNEGHTDSRNARRPLAPARPARYDCASSQLSGRAPLAPSGTRPARAASRHDGWPAHRRAITDGVVRAAQDGEAAAFRVIYEELAPLVLGYLTAKGVADPEAVTGDVFLAALPRLRELSGGAAGLRTFVMSVAHARMVDDAPSTSPAGLVPI